MRGQGPGPERLQPRAFPRQRADVWRAAVGVAGGGSDHRGGARARRRRAARVRGEARRRPTRRTAGAAARARRGSGFDPAGCGGGVGACGWPNRRVSRGQREAELVRLSQGLRRAGQSGRAGGSVRARRHGAVPVYAADGRDSGQGRRSEGGHRVHAHAGRRQSPHGAARGGAAGRR